ncbi:MAG: M56 family metallopeptidase, partial [Myxococcota bacterium]
ALPILERVVPEIPLIAAPAQPVEPFEPVELPPEILAAVSATEWQTLPALEDIQSPEPASTRSSTIPWMSLYIAGVLWFALRRTKALFRLWRLSAKGERIQTCRSDALVRDVSRELGLRRVPTIVRSKEVSTASTWGALRPVLLVPPASVSWSDERWRAVLLHELSHIKNRDWLRLLMGECARCLYWANPAVWFALARLATEREHACDASVLERGIKPSSYATHLLDIARGTPEAPALALPVAGGRLEARIRAILQYNRPKSSRAPTLAALLLLIGASTAFAAVDPQRAENHEPDRDDIETAIARVAGSQTAPTEPVFAKVELEARTEIVESNLDQSATKASIRTTAKPDANESLRQRPRTRAEPKTNAPKVSPQEQHQSNVSNNDVP